MRIDILTLFPQIFTGPFTESIIKRARENGIVDINLHNIRDYATDIHKTVDDSPYGGGPGMVMRIDVLDRSLQDINSHPPKPGLKPKIILMTPQGKTFTQSMAHELSRDEWLILICGHYEGYDERIRSFVDLELSIGDYVLTGGELAAMAISDAIIRLLPGGIGKNESTHEESFQDGLLEYPQYTRPEIYKDMKVPEILLSGNHKAIAEWRLEQAKHRTHKRRPDLQC